MMFGFVADENDMDVLNFCFITTVCIFMMIFRKFECCKANFRK